MGWRWYATPTNLRLLLRTRALAPFLCTRTGQWRIAAAREHLGTNFTATLFALDVSGMSAELKAWHFVVQDKPVFRTSSLWDPGKLLIITKWQLSQFMANGAQLLLAIRIVLRLVAKERC